MLKKIILLFSLFGIIFAECSDGFYEDDCGNCWMPYCYNYVTHNLSYDISEAECNGTTEMWVLPGDSGDPYFNNYCNECPENYYADDCGNCWMGYCYTLYLDGLNGDGPHSVYYDLTPEECESYGYGFYPPGSTGDPYYNSNCEDCPNGEILDDCGICQTGDDSPYWNMTCGDCNGEVNGNALIDDCGECQAAFCYDYITHQVNFDLPCDGATEMIVMPDSPSNPYWNSSCDPNECPDGQIEDCNGECGGTSLVDDCGDCQSGYCYDYVTHEVSFTGECNGPTEMWVDADSPSNPYWNQGCTDCDSNLGDANGDDSIDVSDIVLLVSFILGNTDDIVECTSDINEDGIINVVDVVQIVQLILGNLGLEADSMDLYINNNEIYYSSNGVVGAIELTLEHNSNIKIKLNENSMISDYNTIGNKTKIIIVMPNSEKLLSINGEFKISDVIAVNSKDYISINIINNPTEFNLSNAYPNPFNPKTKIEYSIPNDGNLNIIIYDITGNMVENLSNGLVKAGKHYLEWDGGFHPSGIYFIKFEFNNEIKSQKLYLIK